MGKQVIYIDTVCAEIRRREVAAKERYLKLDRDPTLRAAATRSLAVANAMRELRETISSQREPEDRNTA